MEDGVAKLATIPEGRDQLFVLSYMLGERMAHMQQEMSRAIGLQHQAGYIYCAVQGRLMSANCKADSYV
jgi:hypothetical protein